MTSSTPRSTAIRNGFRTAHGHREVPWMATLLALAACNRGPGELPSRPTPAAPDARAQVAPTPPPPAPGTTGVVEGIVSLTGPIPPLRPLNIDAPTAGRRGCREAAEVYYANVFGPTEPGVMPEALVTVDARTDARPPVRRRYATYRDCHIEPRILAMALGDELWLRAETNEHHLAKVDGMGATIAQMLLRNEDQQKNVQRPGRYILHSVNFPLWMQTPLVVTPNPFYDQTDRAGHYRIENVPPGTWTVHAWFPNTTPVDATVTVRAGETTRRDFSLTPLPAAQIRPNQPDNVPTRAPGPVIP